MAKSLAARDVLKKVLTYLMVVGISFLSALNYHIFVFPNKFAPAGLNGICTMVQFLFDFKLGYLNLLINVPLAIVVYFLVGRSMALRSMVYTLGFSLFILVFEAVDLSAFVYQTANGTSTVLGPLTAGIITGAGAALLYKVNACCGGTEFVAGIIHRYQPQVNFFWIIFGLNISVAGLSYFVYGFQVEPVLLCIIYSFASSAIRDKITQGSRGAVRFEIVTDYPEEISREIIGQLHHSTTLIPAKGMYQQEERSILVCVINKSQVPDLTAIVKAYPRSFVIMSQVSQVIGNFKRLDAKGNPEVQLLDKGK